MEERRAGVIWQVREGRGRGREGVRRERRVEGGRWVEELEGGRVEGLLVSVSLFLVGSMSLYEKGRWVQGRGLECERKR